MTSKNKCSTCGSTLYFEPNICGLKCDKCGAEFSITKQVIYGKVKTDINASGGDLYATPKIKGMHCEQCGAVYPYKNQISGTCEYCNSNLVVDFEDNAQKPHACIPFAFNKALASEYFKNGLKKKKFLPNKFKKNPDINNIESLYIPAFSFDCKTQSDYVGRLVESYRDSEGNTCYRNFDVSGNYVGNDTNIMVECSEKITQSVFDKIKPYNTAEIVRYDDAFIFGYTVEHYNSKMEDVCKTVKAICDNSIRRSILKRYTYSHVDYLKVNTEYVDTRYSYIILPTYKVAFNYKRKVYETFMNGQTGKIGGNLPRSGWKIFFMILAILGLISLPFLVIIINAIQNLG